MELDAAAAMPPVHVRITDIDATTLKIYAATWEGRHPSGYGGFNWTRLWHRHCIRQPRSFQCAVWHGTTLCGLCIGTVPRGRSHLTIRYVEGRPQGHPVRGNLARIVLTAAEYYGRSLELPQLRIENPAPGLEGMYRQLGYALAFREGAVRYLAKDLAEERSDDVL